MTKNILLLVAILFPLLSSHAQVITGGLIRLPVLYPNPASFEISNFEKHLVARDAICSPSNRLLKENDLMQSYLKLSLFRKPQSDQAKCDEVSRYLACLHDKTSKEMVKELKQNEKVVKVLMSRYNINETEAKRVLNFFGQLGKKVQK